MRRSDVPFGNELQDDFDVKVVGGKIVHVTKCAPIVRSDKKPHSKDTGLKKNVEVISSQNSSNSSKELLKLPPIHQATAGRVHKAKFHSAPPKLHCPTAHLVIHPINDPSSNFSEALSIFISQIKAVQRKRPHTLEDIMRSCTRLDDLRSGTIPVQELADVLYVNGVSVNMETLREYVVHNELTANRDSNQVLYKDFVVRIADNKTIPHSLNSSEQTGGLQTQGYSKSSSPFLHRQYLHKNEDNFNYEATHTSRSSGLPSRTVMSCPERQITTATMLGSCDSIVEDDTDSNDVSVLLGDLQSCFVGTRWGSHGDVQRLESALAKADKHNSGCLPPVVISRIFHDHCIPLRGELMDDAFVRCETPQGMIRWTELMELIMKALPGSQFTPRPVPAKTHHTLANSKLHTTAIQQEGISHDTVTNDDTQQQTEELFKRISQQTTTNEPIQKLCNALFTCDPHRTGFIDVKIATRMVRNYNIVYRMGLDMSAIESFIRANSRKNRSHHTETPSTTSVISISLLVNRLLQELGDEFDCVT